MYEKKPFLVGTYEKNSVFSPQTVDGTPLLWYNEDQGSKPFTVGLPIKNFSVKIDNHRRDQVWIPSSFKRKRPVW